MKKRDKYLQNTIKSAVLLIKSSCSQVHIRAETTDSISLFSIIANAQIY